MNVCALFFLRFIMALVLWLVVSRAGLGNFFERLLGKALDEVMLQRRALMGKAAEFSSSSR